MATRRAKKESRKTQTGEGTIAGWRANALELRLSAEDLDLLDNVITVIPILRVLTAIGQEARKRRLTYPVSTVRKLQSCLKAKRLRFGHHRIDMDTIAHNMHAGWFPIHHEGEFLSRVHLALLRCEIEAEQSAPRPVLQARREV